ncbi:hypothetical protein TNCV_2581731 [Trichonephila clavipes]|nr:hypothetical protein TNCV_2581731 [Trichonephila clavipes]
MSCHTGNPSDRPAIILTVRHVCIQRASSLWCKWMLTSVATDMMHYSDCFFWQILLDILPIATLKEDLPPFELPCIHLFLGKEKEEREQERERERRREDEEKKTKDPRGNRGRLLATFRFSCLSLSSSLEFLPRMEPLLRPPLPLSSDTRTNGVVEP